MSSIRKLFLYSQSPDIKSAIRPLGRLNWEILTAADLASARNVINSHDFYVGLVCLTRFDPATLDDLEEFLLGNNSIQWIALATSEEQRSRTFGKIIDDFFYDYHTLPLDIRRLSVIVGHLYGKAALKRLVSRFEGKGQYQMIGTSPLMQKLYQNLQKVIGSEAPILIRGESGTGKELVARAVHQYSTRHLAPFITVNCGSIPATLIQSELFGHEKGAFTGALGRRIGRIESAAGGVIFLDEIGELPLEHQVNLLRFLEEKTIQRVGATEPIRVDARVIAATHVDLEKAVAQGRFREDLYYRINVLQLETPALRDRKEDCELLAHEYFEKFSRDGRCAANGFSKQALHAIKAHDWPGNVRELINRVRRAVVMSENRLLTPADLGLEERGPERSALSLSGARSQTERTIIRRALYLTNNNVSEASRQLGVSRVTLYRLMSKLNISEQ